MTDCEIKIICTEAKLKSTTAKNTWEEKKKKNPQNYFKLQMLHSHVEILIRFSEVPNNNRSSFQGLAST